jgi:hypothetical protein
MAKALWLCTKSQLGGAEVLINGVIACVINKDSGQTALQVKTDAALACQEANGSPYPATYFDTVTQIDDLTSGPLKDDEDAFVIFPGGPAPTKNEGS